MSLFEMNNNAASAYETITGAGSDMPFPGEDEVKQLGHAILTEILDTFGKDATEEHAQRIAHYVIGGIQSAINYFDGQLAEATAKARYFEALLTVLETFRDSAADTYHVATNHIWTPHKGSAKSATTSFAMLEVAETLRRKAKRDNSGFDPAAQYVVFRGVQSANTEEDAKMIYRALDWAREKFPKMHLAVTGNTGAETIALSWAKNKGVTPHIDRINKKEGNAAPFRCNDRLMALKPVMVLYMPTPLNPANEKEAQPNGIAMNMGQKAQDKGILTYRVAKKAEATAQA